MPVQGFAYNANVQLTKNFNVSEFKCKCGRSHQTLINTDLVKKLQEIVDLTGADYCEISSGYRCSTHDRNVGGYGSGPHVEGQAADCSFVKNGKPISTKLLSCLAQDMGFKGIANITSNYAWIHLDLKNRIYKGNEIINYNTVTADFYSYYGIKKSEVLELTNGKQPSGTTVISAANNATKNMDDFIWTFAKEDKIAELQKILNNKGYKLTVDGIAGPKTYTALADFTIERNDRGPLVRWVQERLNDLGFNCGIADGICGQKTMAAINEFQKRYALGIGYMGGTDYVYLLGGKISKK